MIICKKCGKIASFNSYFKGYYCDTCGHCEAVYERKGYLTRSTSVIRPKKTLVKT